MKETDRYFYINGSGEGHTYILQRRKYMGKEDCSRTECDIRLIAAAPDLLEVLREIVGDGVHCDVVPHLHRKALAAIAKATA